MCSFQRRVPCNLQLGEVEVGEEVEGEEVGLYEEEHIWEGE